MIKSETTLSITLRFSASKHLLGRFTVNGHKGVFLIDTGASNSCMDIALAEQYDLAVEGEPLSVTGAGNEKLSAQASQKSHLGYQGQELFQVEFMLIDMEAINSALEEQGESPIDGILGADLLVALSAVIDYKEKRLLLALK